MYTPRKYYLSNWKMIFITICIFLLNSMAVLSESVDDYMKERQKVMSDESILEFGGDLVLTDNEIALDETLLKLKNIELNAGLRNPSIFNVSHHYFDYKDVIKYSKIYQIIKKMPKGAALHVHDTGLLKPDYLLKLTYRENLYVCLDFSLVKYFFMFFESKPNKWCKIDWILMSDLRAESENVTNLDSDIRKQFTMVVADPVKTYTDINIVWRKFTEIFVTITPILTYKPVWEQYFYDALVAFHKENLLYMEVRTTLPQLYDLKGKYFEPEYTAQVYDETLKHFMKNHPDFIGAKIIYAPMRAVDSTEVQKYLDTALKLRMKFPKLIAGFDLVGQEDAGQPLINFLPELLNAKDDLNFFFHAGETNWYGMTTDWNLLDAILLGAKRLGHAYAIYKHPKLIDLVKKRDIALEVNIISNQVLKLVDDIRNHPLSFFFANNLPVVLSSDDPGLWEAEPISHDYFVAFMGAMSKDSGLKALKKLVWNSIKYSAMERKEKILAFEKLEKDWIKFINDVNNFTKHEVIRN